ncbi:MAG: flavodoxin-dependent (E)-4-hydroxy-3-methylbut-2-enyl-diphosphate synthase [Bacilli bacterium]|jgi:(E)-4-hydroxy-3-methylbut-2-enyl-diphosphate synthase|nr:flavodoxin-dependent (E)-4-hydroxy-3-methylbut-2-enyl-diphosphate synthase [Bacilli bacterium]MDD4005689.1 flavodoxin-dependent (E)-4-hydroxy-3-methylbut-2-enyl-diphosphate synthase [Bacilli bacterium]
MLPREITRKINIGRLIIGGQNRVLIQSMCNIKTERVSEVIAQINRATKLGADLMRVSVLDENDAKAIAEIKRHVSIPLVADIHFDYRLALLAIENGVDKIRINPGNIGSEEKIKIVVDACKEYHVPIRVGVNSGSIAKEIASDSALSSAEKLVLSAKTHVAILEKMGFYDIVISLKGSNVLETVEAYQKANETFPYPLHLGITEAGPKDIGLIRSAAGLAPLLIAGIGDTIRISLSDEPEEEILAAKRLLHDLGLYKKYPTIISCPTCGRTQVDVVPMSKRVLKYLEDNNLNLKIAIMGCVVNGPGEAKDADYGMAGGNGIWVLFKKGKLLRSVKDEEAFDELRKEIEKDIN